MANGNAAVVSGPFVPLHLRHSLEYAEAWAQQQHWARLP
jgi:hypothetical protein